MASPRQQRIVLLGPQRRAPTVRKALVPLRLGPGAVAAITAGWEEREAEDLELGEHLHRPILNLELHGRAEDVFHRDPDLFEAVRRRRDRLRELQRLYRLRLRHLGPAVEELLRLEGPPDLLDPEREAAFESLRALDEHHLGRLLDLEHEFGERWRLGEHDALTRHRQELAHQLEAAAALCVAGGHVGILYERLWLFAVFDLVDVALPIVAWSAGAMALSERIVLFHDSPPQGRGYAEVLGPGLGLCPGVVPFPHASRRLHLDDPIRVQLLARRFPEAICVALDEGAQMTWDGATWTASPSTQQLGREGALEAVAAGGSA